MKRILRIFVVIVILLLALALGMSSAVVKKGKADIAIVMEGETVTLTEGAPAGWQATWQPDEGTAMTTPARQADAILILGAGLSADGGPSPMLKDRLDLGILLYKGGYAPKILLSGDNGDVAYNEVKAMANYTLAQGVPAKDIFCDYAGFSTYDSLYRARDVFLAQDLIVVTQGYHLYRALYIGKSLGLTVYGAAADQQQYHGQFNRDVREVLARDKDFLGCLLQVKPKYLGDPIPLDGIGNATQIE